MEQILASGAAWPAAVGVSGGPDSVALLFLLTDWSRKTGRAPPIALTVDHGLQPGSKRVADGVAARARNYGLTAHVLRWTGRKPCADVERAAREARYRLMGRWCRENGIRCLFVAHSMDDQAETFLLRLMRGSGVDGLAAMAPVSLFPAPNCETLRLARPLLGVPRARLREYLRKRDENWVEDDMNTDGRFARARLREGWRVLCEMGFSSDRIAAAARHLARARAALDHDTRELLDRASRVEGETVFLDAEALAAAPEEIGLRALAQVLMQVSGQFYRPRFDRLERLIAAVRLGSLRGGRTLHGCCIKPASKRLACFGPRTLGVTVERGRRGNRREARKLQEFL